MYSLVAMGIVLIYKSSSVPNLAQGSMTMLGAYVVLAFANNAKTPIWLAIVLAIVTMFGVGMTIERVALRRLAGRPIIMILMMTLGLEILLRAGSMTIWGGTGRPMPLGISDDPLFLGPLLINRTYAWGRRRHRDVRPVHAVLPDQWVWCYARSRMTIPRRGRWNRSKRGVALSLAMSAVVARSRGVWASVQASTSSHNCCSRGVTVRSPEWTLGGALLASVLLGIVEGVAASFSIPCSAAPA